MVARIPQLCAAVHSGFLSRWALAPVVVARTVAIAQRLIVKLDLDEALVMCDCRFGGDRRVAVRLNRQQQPARGFKVGDDVV
jgi:hypothetical protein